MSAVQVMLYGIIADSIYSVRSLTTKTLKRVRDIELKVGVEPSVMKKNRD